MITIFSKLLIAHLIGDFLLFRNRRLKKKGVPVWKSGRLVIHAMIHFVLAWIALGEVKHWLLAAAIGVSHYVSEVAIRTSLSKRPQWAFATDQLLHGLLLFLIAGYICFGAGNLWDRLSTISLAGSWVTAAGLVAVTFPAAKFIEVFLAQWPPTKSAEKVKGLVNAGLWIGILERILIYIFIVTGHWEGIGFLLAAKSVFRFGDLTNSKDISLTEYIMVGTLLSFCFAVVAGLIANYFLV